MTEYKDGFIVVNYGNQKRLLQYMEVDNISLYKKSRKDYLDFYKKEKLNGIKLENEIYYNKDNIDFLINYPFIEILEISGLDINDFSGLEHVKSLRSLILHGNRSTFDLLTLCPNLTQLSITWHKKVKNLSNLNRLKKLYILKDIEELELPPTLRDLKLHDSKRTSLEALNSGIQLKTLSIYNCKKLIDIDSLESLSNTMEELEIEKCKNIEDYSVLKQLKKLKKLVIRSSNKDKTDHINGIISHLPIKLKVFS